MREFSAQEKWVGKVLGVHRNMGAEKAGHWAGATSCSKSRVGGDIH